jgi:DNA uptake protein ComE-like DNA-binding protein
MEVRDDSDATRLRAQRRYFGISEAGGSPQASIQLGKEYGKLAAAETKRVLAQPFTIHTSFADARGDAKFKRIYAFVTTADGEDLGERLVRLGLARAFGVYRETPDGQQKDVYKERLRDLELVASRKAIGIWAKTEWDKLPAERQLQRAEDSELDIATGAKKTGPAGMLDLNTAARDELMSIPGVGEKMANRIIEGRPYATIDELDNVDGIGPKTLEMLMKYVRINDQQCNHRNTSLQDEMQP